MITREFIKKLIAENNIERAINDLLTATKGSKQNELYNATIQLSSRFNSNEKDKMMGILGNDNYNLEKSRIINGLLYQLEKYVPKIEEPLNPHKSENTDNLDDFLRQINQRKIDNIKKRLQTNYDLLNEYEQQYNLEQDPKRRARYKMEIDDLKNKIEEDEGDLKAIMKI